MKFSYKFNNLLGAVYKEGDILFTPDGNSVISPVGNRITIFDLKNNKSTTLPTESRFNYTALDLSPSGCILIAINEEGEAHLISLISHTITHKYRFKKRIACVKFSPNGEYIAFCKDNIVFIFTAPGQFAGGSYNEFVMKKVYHNALEETICLDWSADSNVVAVGAKDKLVRLFPIAKDYIFNSYTLGSHTDTPLTCFFEQNSLDITTLSRNGQLCLWECSHSISDVRKVSPNISHAKRAKKSSESEEDDVDATKSVETTENDLTKALENIELESNDNRFFYKRLAVHYLSDEIRKSDKKAVLTAAAYNQSTKILVTGYSCGAFFIYEMPEVNTIHSLSISEQTISSIKLNNTSDWIALGCGGIGQLLVWEWQSETYVMKQQGHATNMTCVSYSLDGQHVATGGDDGKVKLWNLQSCYCVVTFSEHTNLITSLAFSGNKKFVVSASLDGTVRAYDMARYRNFRTFTTPRPIQFACVAVDASGEFVAAGGQDVFEVYLWSMKMGRLLEILSGHEGPIGSLCFSPNPASTTLASVSWDGTLRIWEALEKGSAHETIELGSDGIFVAFKPNGQEVAVATLNGQISTFDVRTATNLVNIDGRNDLGSGRLDTDLVTSKQTLKAKSFTSLCYTADGECVLAGGQSKNICIYNLKEGILLKKFVITQNRSFNGVDDFINRRKMTEYGNLALIEEREEREGGNVKINLPGVKRGDMAARNVKLEVRVFDLQFSPTGQQWAVATTEGLLIYSLNTGILFDPWELQINITPSSVREAIKKEEFANALMMSMKLNEANLITEIIENIPIKNVELIIGNLNEKYIERLLIIIASALDASNHLEFYLIWAEHLLTLHGSQIKGQKNLAALLSLQKSLTKKYEQLAKICDFNKYTMKYIAQLGEIKSKKITNGGGGGEAKEEVEEEDSDSDMLFELH